MYTCVCFLPHECDLRSAGEELLKAGEWNEVGSFAKSYSTGGGGEKLDYAKYVSIYVIL